MLTKRPGNLGRYLPADWCEGYTNVWLGVSVDDRKHGFPRLDILRETPAAVRFLSCEPLLEDVSDIDLTGIDWVIVGGESRAGSRVFDVEWARKLRDRCGESHTPFIFKQLGSRAVEDGTSVALDKLQPNGKRDRHGKYSAYFPPDLMVQEWPDPNAVSQSHPDGPYR
ncbi:MAG: DUF5131 family protein [Terriglobales bacterium]